MEGRAGRPSKYHDEIPSMLEDYIQNYAHYGDVVPTAAGFACVAQVDKTTLYRWAEKYPIFRTMLGRLNSAQERIAIQKGLCNEWNATIVKLLLAKHGYSDKQEITGSESGPLQITYKVVHADRSKD